MSSALTPLKMSGFPLHVRYVTGLGRMASSLRSRRRPTTEARKKLNSVTPLKRMLASATSRADRSSWSYR